MGTFERLTPNQIAQAGKALKGGQDQEFKRTVAASRDETADEIRRIFAATGDLVETTVANFDAVLVHAEPDDSAPADLEILRTRVRDDLWEIARYRNPGRKGQLKKTVDRARVNEVRDLVAAALEPVLMEHKWVMPSTVMLCENEDLLAAILNLTGQMLSDARRDHEATLPHQPASLFHETAA